MKKYIFFYLFFALVGVGACFDDETIVATDATMIDDIAIGELRDTTAVAYTTVLKITPDVADNPAYSYAWYVYGESLPTDKGYRTVKIGSEKTLSYVVNLGLGSYTLVFEVTDMETGYCAMKEMALQVITAFSQGFYILKEVGGNTEIDMYNTDNGEKLSDLFAMTQGKSLPGTPTGINVLYGMAYVDPETAAASSGAALFVAYGENEMACFRTTDLMKVFDRTTLLFNEMAEDEIPYSMATAGGTYLFSNKGVRRTTSLTGKYGYPVGGEGASRFFQACDGAGLMYWNEITCRLEYTNGSAPIAIEYYGNEINWNDVEPIATGWNHLVGVNTMWYVFENAVGERWLVLINSSRQVTEVRALDASLHIAQSNIIAGNGLTSSTIYSVHDNTLWRYSIDNGTENATPLQLTGVAAGEEIVFLSDIYFQTEFDYIVVGTQNGDNYTLYMYEIQGGQPYGSPVHVVKGKGFLKQVRYVSQSSISSPNYYAFTDYAIELGMGPDFPY